MKIIQLTDLHLPAKGEDTMGIDVYQNFLNVLDAVQEEQPDHIVITGDLCLSAGNKSVYTAIKFQLDKLDVPYSIISGNHDDPLMLVEVFQTEHLLVGEELFYKRVLGGRKVLFLETSNGYMSEAQLNWLERELRQMRDSILIFMHHPPLLAGVPHMDSHYPLQNRDELISVLCNTPLPVMIFCGHYHVDKTLCHKNLTVQITPSTYFQIDWRMPAFAIDHYSPAYRVIELRPDHTISSSLVYIKGAKL